MWARDWREREAVYVFVNDFSVESKGLEGSDSEREVVPSSHGIISPALIYLLRTIFASRPWTTLPPIAKPTSPPLHACDAARRLASSAYSLPYLLAACSVLRLEMLELE